MMTQSHFLLPSSSLSHGQRPVGTLLAAIFKGLTLLFAVWIAVESLEGMSQLPPLNHADKIMHVLGYFILTGLVGGGWPLRSWRKLALLVCLYGVGIELLQGAMHAGRTASILDVAANVVGICLAIFVWSCVVDIYKEVTRSRLPRE